MLSSLFLFLAYSIPPLAGWWLCFRAPFGARRFHRSIVIAAPVEAVWRLLDPRGPQGGWSIPYETRNAETASAAPLVLRLERRPRRSCSPFRRVEEECLVDETAHRIARVTRGEGERCEVNLSRNGSGATATVIREKPVTGLLAYELTRLALARDLGAMEDAVLGRDAKAAPLFRFSGWRLALLGVVSGVVMVLMILAPGFYVALQSMGVSLEALLADRAARDFMLTLAFAATLLLAALLIAATLVHEMGHALALAAFGHRGVTVSLIPFGGGVALGARDHGGAFEAGAVGLAGPALSALAAFAVMPDPVKLSALMQGLAGAEPDFAAALAAFAGAAFVLLTLLVNIPNILPWTGSDGALALGAIFRNRRARHIAAGLFAALLAFIFAGIDDLLPFGLMFLALSWFNRKRPEAAADAVGNWRRLALAAGLALVVGLYAHEASALRGVEWLPRGQGQPAPDRA